MGVRSLQAVSAAVATLAVLGLTSALYAAAPPTLCKSTNARGTVTYSDCPPPTTYRPDARPATSQPDDTPPPPAQVAPATPAPIPSAETPHERRWPWDAASSAPHSLARTPLGRIDAPRPVVAALGAFRPAFSGERVWLVGGVALILVGLGINVVTGIQYLTRAFRVGVWWGLGCLFVAPVNLLFLILHWRLVKKPVLVSVLGTVLLIAGVVVARGW